MKQNMNDIIIRLGVLEEGIHQKFRNAEELFGGKFDEVIEQVKRTNGDVVRLKNDVLGLRSSYNTLFSSFNGLINRVANLELMKLSFRDIRTVSGLAIGVILTSMVWSLSETGKIGIIEKVIKMIVGGV